MPGMHETDTCRILITPALHHAGWAILRGVWPGSTISPTAITKPNGVMDGCGQVFIRTPSPVSRVPDFPSPISEKSGDENS